MHALIRSLILFLAAGSANVYAQRCGATCSNAVSLIGLSEQALTSVIPELIRAKKPMVGPRHSIGKWLLQDARLGKESYLATYFIKSGLVTRIEYLSTASRPLCEKRTPFELALSELASVYGSSQVSGAFEGSGRYTQSAAFISQTIDIALHYSLTPDDCSTRIIFKPRELKDGSEL